MKNLKEKYGDYALVTGASSGIGESFTRRLAEFGMNLILIARREERLEKIKNEIQSKYKVDVMIIPLDLTEPNFIDEIIKHTSNKEIGILINNAGFGSTGYFENNDSQNEIDMVKLNCVAPTILTHHFINPMIERKKGAVIFLGSVVAVQPTPMMTVYSATKVFNAYLGESLWFEMKKHNIDVLSLNPGGTTTEFQRIADVSSGPFARKPEQVVETALKSLGKKPSVIDGIPNKFSLLSTRLLPKKLKLRLTGSLMESFFKKGKS